MDQRKGSHRQEIGEYLDLHSHQHSLDHQFETIHFAMRCHGGQQERHMFRETQDILSILISNVSYGQAQANFMLEIKVSTQDAIGAMPTWTRMRVVEEAE